MGNKDDLLAGAKRCLTEKGYTATTARDVATAAGTSLAAIGYHFGSVDALLRQALMEAIGEWGEELGRALMTDGDGEGDGAEFEEIWARIIETLPAHRPLWATQFELVGKFGQLPHLREFLVEGQRRGRTELAALFGGIDAERDPRAARLVGALHQALLAGVMVQWLVDPDQALSAAELREALALVADQVTTGTKRSAG
jgi:AcrR family transcriptional regulator